jgi:hypothetical protein
MNGTLAEAIAAGGTTRVVVSRATWLTSDDTGSVPLVSCPVVGGETVWNAVVPQPGDVWVVEVPNYFGRFERNLPVDGPVIAIRRCGPAPPSVPVLEVESVLPEDAVRAAHKLGGAIRQLPGVTLAHGMPVSPWFVVLLPGSAATAAEVLAANGFPGCIPLEARYPELPGGLRIAVAWPATRRGGFVAALQESLEPREG